ncbi:MAG: ammonium transporter [Patescibacteria group bacterium]
METSPSELVLGLNTAWVVLCAALVFFMQAGFAMLETGLTRAKNAVNILMKNMMDVSVGVVVFFAVGFAFMFGSGNGFMGMDGFFMQGFGDTMSGVSTPAFWFFQAMFASAAATIVSGALAERVKFRSYFTYSIFITALIYPIVGHWVWGGGWLGQMGFLDFAGSTVVHSIGGWASLVGAIMIGPRIGRFDNGGKGIAGHNFPLAMLGAFILWFGWYGFNPGSQLAIASAADAHAVSLVALNTTLAAGAGAVAAMIFAWIKFGIPHAAYAVNGLLAGLVGITAGCAFVTPEMAIVIGVVAGIVTSLGVILLEKLKVDDAVGAAPVHAFSGVWGTLAVGLFHTEKGLFYGAGWHQLGVEALGAAAVALWTIVTMYILFSVIRAVLGLRVSQKSELAGLDSKHGLPAYSDQL